jgi:hypothetical protein
MITITVNGEIRVDMTDRIVAYCGLICSDCSAYIATQADDQSALERVAAEWKEEYNLAEVTITDVTCDGCIDEKGRKGAHCFECEIRACGLARGVVNCAHCPDYACEKLESFFGYVPGARAVMNEIKTSLQ